MFNIIPVAVLILFLAGALFLFARRRAPFSFVILAAGLGAVSIALWPFGPVSAKGERDAIVLSRAGPLGAQAYRTAMVDGRITHTEMFAIREAAGRDIDAEFGLTAPNGEKTHSRP
jgi:hypothetical protein